MTQRVTQQTESNKNAPVLLLDLAVRVCDNVNMKLRIPAICTIVVFAACAGRALAQFPDCAHTSTEGQAACQPAAQAVYIVNDRTDGQVQVTIHVVVLDNQLPGTTTSLNNVLTLAAGERQKLGCLLFAPGTRYTWDLVDCQPL